jgi:Xaa-Pro aminopeptidase
MGVLNNHYHSDMTRTVAVGEKLPARLRDIYDVTLAAQQEALAAVAPGKRCKDIDAIARAIIAEAGYGEFFGHGLGHGVGLEIHEGPTLNPRSEDVLQPGMIITIEPGIYLPGLGGVRIEDLVVVTATGYKNLTSLSKSFRHIL